MHDGRWSPMRVVLDQVPLEYEHRHLQGNSRGHFQCGEEALCTLSTVLGITCTCKSGFTGVALNNRQPIYVENSCEHFGCGDETWGTSPTRLSVTCRCKRGSTNDGVDNAVPTHEAVTHHTTVATTAC